MGVIVGIDEVGRGCWAGPLVACAVVLDDSFDAINYSWKLTDSKLLNKSEREVAESGIREVALSIGIGWVEPEVIDEVGLSKTIKIAMQRAMNKITVRYDEIIIDGNINFLNENSGSRAVIKADVHVPVVSAASIVAKVARDRFMAELATEFPHYGFEQHVGYGTKLHAERLKQYGVCRAHRKSYKPIKLLVGNEL